MKRNSPEQTEKPTLPIAPSEILLHSRHVIGTYLAGHEHSADLPDDRFVAAEVRLPFEDETQVVAEVVSFVFPTQLDRKSDNSVLARRKLHEASA